MDASTITALAALVGAAVGGVTSVGATLLIQRMQVRAQWLAQEVDRGKELYKEFTRKRHAAMSTPCSTETPDIAVAELSACTRS